MDTLKDRLNTLLSQKVAEEQSRRSQALALNKDNLAKYAAILSDYSQFKSAVELLVSEANASALAALGYTLESVFQDAGAVAQYTRFSTMVENPQINIPTSINIQGRITLLRTGHKPTPTSPALMIQFLGHHEQATILIQEPKSNRRIQTKLVEATVALSEELLSFIQRSVTV
jgi:hypothetical protein